jgi:hypothetical protein
MHFYDKCCTNHIRSATQTRVISGNKLVNTWCTNIPTLQPRLVSSLGAPYPPAKRMQWHCGTWG